MIPARKPTRVDFGITPFEVPKLEDEGRPGDRTVALINF